MSQLKFNVNGMVCAGCVETIQQALTRLDGVSGASVDLESRAASVDHDASVTADAVFAAVRDAGFGVCKCANCQCDPCQCK